MSVRGFILVSVLATILLVSLGWAAPSARAAEGSGVVIGRVINGTAGGQLPGGLEITLRAFSETSQMARFTTTCDAEGNFRFEGVDANPDLTYIVVAEYGGVTYSSRPGRFAAGESELVLPLTIYESTEDPSGVEVERLHLFLSFDEVGLLVGEFYIINNLGDRTYVGDKVLGQRATLRFALPEAASELRFQGGELGKRFIATDEGFADTAPVYPGLSTMDLSFSYYLPYKGGLRFSRPLSYPVANLDVLLPDVGVALESTKLEFRGARQTEMGVVLVYAASDLPTGESLEFTLSGMPRFERESAPAVPPVAPSSQPLVEAGIGLAALGLAAAGVYLWWRRASEKGASAQEEPLLRAIANLDERFEAGKVGEAAYRAAREELKAQLRELMGGEKP